MLRLSRPLPIIWCFQVWKFRHTRWNPSNVHQFCHRLAFMTLDNYIKLSLPPLSNSSTSEPLHSLVLLSGRIFSQICTCLTTSPPSSLWSQWHLPRPLHLKWQLSLCSFWSPLSLMGYFIYLVDFLFMICCLPLEWQLSGKTSPSQNYLW